MRRSLRPAGSVYLPSLSGHGPFKQEASHILTPHEDADGTPVEVEAKFSFGDAAAFAAWQQRDAIGPFTLGPTRSKDVVDRYLDTDLCDCIAGGYACRIRTQDSSFEVTLKSLLDATAGTEAEVRRREEIELTLTPPAGQRKEGALAGLLPALQQPVNWPESEARTLAMRLTEGRPLRHLVTIHQQRRERDLLDGERALAVQSMDRVSFDRSGPAMLELEVELTPQGTDEDMATVVRALSAEEGFQPDRRSKLGGALGSISPPTERSVLAQNTLFAAQLPEERDRHCAVLALRLLGSVGDRDDEGTRRLARSAIMAIAEGRTVRPDDPAGAPIGNAGRVAAAIGVALALNASGRQTTRIVAITSSERRTLLTLSGPNADEDGAAAEEVTGLWQEGFGVELRCRSTAPNEPPPLGLRFDQGLAGAGRIILRNQYERLQACAADVRAGDHEALHDGRVAVRRMRTALHLLQGAYVNRETAPLVTGLKRAGARLGAVRDLDVLLSRMHREKDQLPDPPVLDGLLEAWEQRRQKAHRRLLKHLDSGGFRDWNDRFTTFLESSSSGPRGNSRVADLLSELVWRRYGIVRSYQPDVDSASAEELHELRKNTKELRYLLEFFRELLGKSAPALIKQLTGVQDELGALHDAIVLRDLVGKASAGARTPGLEQYHLRVLAAIPLHRRDFEGLWPAVVERDFRRALAEAVAAV